ncbi:MAG: low molecular weight protein arginine phosphatase [Opitutales bacterium]
MPVDPERPFLTFVCTANVCRSPMAERLVRHALDAEEPPLNKLRTRSAGVSAYPGDPPSENSVVALEKVGIPLTDHASQRLTQEMIDQSLALFVMTESHKALLQMHYQLSTPHVYLFREFLDADPEIPDPFGQDIHAYELTRDSMVEAVPSIIQFLKKTLKA